MFANPLKYPPKSKEDYLYQIACKDFNGDYGIVDKEQAVSIWLRNAQNSHLESMFQLGRCYWHGEGVISSKEIAIEWWKKASACNHLESMNNIAKCHYNGDIVEESDALAVECWTIAAKQGHLDSMYELGKCCCYGWGVEEDKEIAVEWWTRAAERDHLESMNELALCYIHGEGVEEDETIAVEWWTKAAKQGHLDSMNELANCYFIGIGVDKSYESATEWWLIASNQGHLDSMNQLGACYKQGWGGEENNDVALEWWIKANLEKKCTQQSDLNGVEGKNSIEETVELWQKKAKQGHLDSMYELGHCYRYGWGIEKDKTVAILWWTKAADQGHLDSMYELGHCYCYGWGIEKDETIAVSWWIKAAKQGHLDSMYELGNCYLLGLCFDRDLAIAVEWYIKAAKMGHSESIFEIATYYFNGDNGFDCDDSMAVQWWQKSADNNHLRSMCKLGDCFFNGWGVDECLATAVSWWSLAASSGHEESMHNLAMCYSAGFGVKKSSTVALMWHTKAARRDNSESMYALGHIYNRGGWGVNICHSTAFHWWKLAAKNGHASANFWLGNCYFNGIGVDKSDNKAVEYWEDALIEGCLDSLPQITEVAKNNNIKAIVCLADAYYYGCGVEKDEAIAVEWWSKAAELGDLDSMSKLAECYYYGVGIEKDEAVAIEWWTKAANIGYSKSMHELGDYYSNYCAGNCARTAVDWFLKAAKKGHLVSTIILISCYENGYGTLVNQLEANFWRNELLDSDIQDADWEDIHVSKIITQFEIAQELNKELPPQNSCDDTSALSELNNMIGLEAVKERVKALINEVNLKNERMRRGLPKGKSRSYHMIFSGNPGTGKTVVARLLAKIFYDLGVISQDKFIETDRSGLVGEYVGHTAIKTNEIIDLSLGGVLFIDEAYALNGSDNDFGKEAIETLLKRMEDERDNLVVIVAGYSNEMSELMGTNPGLQSRFSRELLFSDYNEHDLTAIFQKIAGESHYILDDELLKSLPAYSLNLKAVKGDKFSNGREMRNTLERTIENQEFRISSDGRGFDSLSDDELQTLTVSDLPNL
ncbi:TPA: AAA family ATPase [Photobacterium damselae]